MADWRDVMLARDESDRLRDAVTREDSGASDDPLVTATLAVAAELRALGTLIDYARGDAR